MLRRIALTLASGAAVCTVAICLTSAFPASRKSSSSRSSASDESPAVTQVALRRSGYIVASS
jgi:hypothetical protein